MNVARLRILLVEDNALDARAMLKFLASNDLTTFETRHVHDLASATSALDEEGFDCVLLDLSLPDSEGLASVSTLIERSAKAPIVVLTGHDDPNVAVQAVEYGAQDYVTKRRANAETVGRAIRYAVTRHHSETQLRIAHETLQIMEDRERIAGDLHDHVIGQLFATGMSLQAEAGRSDDPGQQDRILASVDGIDDAIRQLRETIFSLHQKPTTAILTDDIHAIVESHHEALGFAPTIHLQAGIGAIPPQVRTDLLATIRESLSNAAKYANATAVEIRLDIVDSTDLLLTVTDNGVGISLESLQPSSARSTTGHGLRNMTRRAEALSGDFRIGPGPAGGTRLEWRAPIADQKKDLGP